MAQQTSPAATPPTRDGRARHDPTPAEENAAFAEHDHRDIQGGTARAAVFGISDGLLTNVSLILGVAGAHPSAGIVRLAGLAGLVAGAFSMAAGEYVSMTAQVELYAREVAVEQASHHRDPAGERDELVGLYVERGVRPEIAAEVASVIMRDPELALRVHTQEEIGVAPEAVGSPVAAAVASFVSFALGAFIPLIPWLFASGTGAVIGSIALGAITSVTIGVALAQFTGRSRLRSAARQLGIAVVAAAVTYGVGAAVGVRTA